MSLALICEFYIISPIHISVALLLLFAFSTFFLTNILTSHLLVALQVFTYGIIVFKPRVSFCRRSPSF